MDTIRAYLSCLGVLIFSAMVGGILLLVLLATILRALGMH